MSRNNIQLPAIHTIALIGDQEDDNHDPKMDEGGRKSDGILLSFDARYMTQQWPIVSPGSFLVVGLHQHDFCFWH